MKWRTLDEIVSSVLIQKGYSVHFYCQFLKYASDCLRELHFDVLGNVKPVKLTVNSYGVVEIPCDYVDWVRIGTPCGGDVHPLSGRGAMNRLHNYDSSGQIIPYTVGDTDRWCYGGWWGWWTTYHCGPVVGIYGGPYTRGSFSVFKERNEIQFHNWAVGDFMILEYITDCSDPDNATQVEPYAQKTIERYIVREYKANNRSYSPAEVREEDHKYNNEHRILRARMSDLTHADIRSIVTR